MKKILYIFSITVTTLQWLTAQTCGTCAVNITTINISSYTVGSGQIFCVDTTGKFTGTLVLNGGTICNKGVFKPQQFVHNSGTITNFGSATLFGNIVLGSGKTLTCGSRSFLKVAGSFTVGGGTFSNGGITNILNNISFSSGTFSNTGVINCKLLAGSTSSIVNTGIINHE